MAFVSRYYRPIETEEKKEPGLWYDELLLSANLIAVDMFGYLQT